MLITKFIELQIDVEDPMDFYADEDANLLNIIKSKYENKCHSGAIIVNITGIVAKSPGIVETEQSYVYVKMYVKIKAIVEIYPIGSIINGVSIVKDVSTIDALLCASKNAIIIIKKKYGYEKFHNMMFSVIVINAMYPIGESKCSINAVPFMYDLSPEIFHISAPELRYFDNRGADEYAARVKTYADDIANLEKNEKSRYKFFADVLSPIKNTVQVPQGATLINFGDIVDKKLEGWFVRDPRCALDPRGASDHIYYYSKRPDELIADIPSADIYLNKSADKGKKIVYRESEMDSRTSYISLHNVLCTNMNQIMEYIMLYNNKDTVVKHVPLWEVLNANKI